MVLRLNSIPLIIFGVSLIHKYFIFLHIASESKMERFVFSDLEAGEFVEWWKLFDTVSSNDEVGGVWEQYYVLCFGVNSEAAHLDLELDGEVFGVEV